MSDRTIGILGLGIFGSSVLAALAKHDMNIIAIDDHEERINQFEISRMKNSFYQRGLTPVIP